MTWPREKQKEREKKIKKNKQLVTVTFRLQHKEGAYIRKLGFKSIWF